MADRVRPYVSQDNYWVLVTDPNEYSFRDLERDTQTSWDGVADYVSLKNLQDLDEGEQVLIFHSGDQMAFVGTARIASDPYPSPRETDASMVAVDVEALEPLDPPVPLLDIQDLPEFQDFDLVTEPEIEVAPITPGQWDRICQMSRDAVAHVTREERL